MKKFYSFLIAAVALVGFAACESNEEATPEAEMMSFVASFADETRTELEGMNVKWCAGDTILVTDGQGNYETFTTAEGGATATFTGKEFGNGTEYYAIYGDNNATFDGTWTYTVAKEQDVKAGSFADGAAVSVATYADGVLSFTNECAVIKFQVESEATDVVFGDVVTVKGKVVAGTTYYAVVAPGSYTFSSIKTNGDVVYENKTLNCVANKIYNVGILPVKTRMIYLNAGGSGLWDQAGAWMKAHFWKSSTDDFVDVRLEKVGSYYQAKVDKKYDMVIFLRMSNKSTDSTYIWNKADDNNVYGYWNKTGDLSIPAGKNCFTITGWSEDNAGSWSKI